MLSRNSELVKIFRSRGESGSRDSVEWGNRKLSRFRVRQAEGLASGPLHQFFNNLLGMLDSIAI